MTRRKDHLDEIFMLQCLTLAEKGKGSVSPNPMVGALVVKNNKIIGNGFHKKFGADHAEVTAISSAKRSVRGSTLYVNLEPCNHTGKTPPCTKLIISSGIREVIVGMRDPNPLVHGKGIKELRRAGIKVKVGVCEPECQALNESFIKFIRTKIPFVTLKIAQTIDGKIADIHGSSKWISNKQSRTVVHRLRSQYDAVLVGSGTIVRDNPSLTVRVVKGRNPSRIIIDGRLSIPLSAKVVRTAHVISTLLFASNRFLRIRAKKRDQLARQRVEIFGLPSDKNGAISLKQVLKILGEKNIASILVEGGTTVFSGFMEKQLADKLLLFMAPKILGKGLGPFDHISNLTLGGEITFHNVSLQLLGEDVLLEAYLH